MTAAGRSAQGKGRRANAKRRTRAEHSARPQSLNLDENLNLGPLPAHTLHVGSARITQPSRNDPALTLPLYASPLLTAHAPLLHRPNTRTPFASAIESALGAAKERPGVWLCRVLVGLLVAALGAVFPGNLQPARAQAQSELGRPSVETYAADTYGNWRGDVNIGHRQNWGVTQGRDGVIYVANQDGVLSYDGARWSVIPVHHAESDPIPGGTQIPGSTQRRNVFSIGRLPAGHPDSGRILVGARGTFGMLRRDSLGQQVYRPLSTQIAPDGAAQVGTVSQIAATRQAAYFRTDRRLYQWKNGNLSTWSPSDLPDRPAPSSDAAAASFSALFTVRDTAYVHVRGAGLWMIEAGRFERVAATGRFANADVQVLLPHGDAETPSLLAITSSGAFFEITTTGTTWALDGPVEDWLEAHGLIHGTRLRDGSLALATRDGGLIRTTATGQRIHVLDTGTGLQTDVVNHVFADRAGSLWLSLGDGIARVDASAPFSYFDESLGLSSGVEALERHIGTLYACTRDGLHRLASPAGAFARMRPVPGVDTACSGLASTAGGLLVATAEGTLVVREDGTIYTVDPDNAYSAVATPTLLHPAPGLAFVATAQGGVERLRTNKGRWTLDTSFSTPTELDALSLHDLAWARDGSLWAAAPEEVIKLDNARSPSLTVTRFGETSGLPVSRDMRVFTVGDGVFVGTRNGLYRHVDTTAASSFVPDTTFEASWAEEDAYVTHLIETAGGGVWGRAVENDADGGKVITSIYQGPAVQVHNSRPLVPFRDVIRGPFLIEGPILWVGDRGIAPLSRLDFSSIMASSSSAGPASRATSNDASAGPPIRRVAVGAADSTLYGGGRPGASLRILGDRQPIHIDYALPRFVLVATPVEYRTRLDRNEPWSSWSRKASVDYAGLSPGRYRFQVQARLPGEVPTAVTTLPFYIVPPWYQTSWALVLWIVLALSLLAAAVGTGVRWRTRRLERRQEQLKATVDARTHQVQEQNEQLADQADRLQRLDRLKSEFFANVSHEFRTPLTLIIGPLEDLQTDTRSSLSAVGRQNVAFALRNSRRLLRLIGQLLDTAKLETGKLTLDTQVLNLNTFVHGLARSFTPLAERGQVRLHVKIPDDPTPVDVDPDKLEKVLGNLISNALKFTPDGGQVLVTVARDQNNAVFRVQDSGPGIPADDQERIFDRFYQSESAERLNRPGTGIGLALAKDLTELHGGTINVENVTVENGVVENGVVENNTETGAVFTVRFPVSDRPAENPRTGFPPPRPIDSEAAAEAAIASGDGATTEPDQPRAPSDPANERTTLLVVDDNDEIRAYVRSHFEPQYRILEASNGREALNTTRAELPDLVISDVMMPDVDGFELVRILRSRPETDFLPVILLTARATEEDRLAGLDEGSDAYVTKPFSMRELHTRVENLIASRKRLKARYTSEPETMENAPAIEGLNGLSPSEQAYIERARDAVITHLGDEDFGVEDLADALSQSRSTVYRRLRDALDETPTAFIRDIRLRHSAAMLRNGEGTVSEVAYAVGFRSVSHFSQSFRDLYGVAPSAYPGEVNHG